MTEPTPPQAEDRADPTPPQPEATTRATLPPDAPEPPSGNMDLLKSLFLGATVTAVAYEVFPLPFLDEGRVLSVLDNRISAVIVGMTLWSLFLLLYKYLRFRREQVAHRAFLGASIQQAFAQGVYARDAHPLVERLRQELGGIRHFERSVIYRRVVRLLRHVHSLPQKEGLNDFLDYQSQIDQKRLENSYAIVQVFIWAIPILGFIGTVMGIGASVSEFAVFIQTAEGGGEFSSQMRAALGGVTSGLAVAFNTTFLALVLVIPVMILTSFLQKLEEEFLLGIEEYCLERLVPHLHVTPGDAAGREEFNEHLHRIMQLSNTWLGQLEPLVGRMSRQTEMVSHQMAGIQPLIKRFTDQLFAHRQATGGEDEATSEAESATGDGTRAKA